LLRLNGCRGKYVDTLKFYRFIGQEIQDEIVQVLFRIRIMHSNLQGYEMVKWNIRYSFLNVNVEMAFLFSFVAKCYYRIAAMYQHK
jgi:hypothetical protein